MQAVPRLPERPGLRGDPHSKDHLRGQRGRRQCLQGLLLQGIGLPRSISPTLQADGDRCRVSFKRYYRIKRGLFYLLLEPKKIFI